MRLSKSRSVNYGFKCHRITTCAFLLLLVCIYSVISETQWVWSRNQSPLNNGNSASLNSNFNNNNNFGQTNLVPELPRPSDLNSNFNNNNNNNNNALPLGTIRVVNSQGEARLIPGAANFVSNALSGLSNLGGGSGSAGGSGGGGGQGLFGIGSGLVQSLITNGPQIAAAALNSLLGGNRVPSNGGSSNSNTPTNVNGNGNIPSFPSNPSGGGGGISSILGNGGSSSSPSTSGGSSNCRCIPLNNCFLPSRPNGDCGSGNTNCCATSQSTRAISADDFSVSGSSGSSSSQNSANSNVINPTNIRAGLLENIVRGSSSVFDDALDLVLQPWLTQEDQQKLANRIGSRTGSG